MGVRAAPGVPDAGAAGRGGGAAAVDAGGEATDTPVGAALGAGAAKPPLCRGATGALGAGVTAFDAATGRGATIGRAAVGAPCDADPGIIGRGGNRTGRLAPGAGPLGVGGNPVGFTFVGAACESGACGAGGTPDATEFGAGVRVRAAAGGGASVSANAAARP